MQSPLEKQWVCRIAAVNTVLLLLFLFIPLYQTPAEETDSQPVEGTISLTEMSLENLMDIEITSVSRKKEQMVHAPAAIYVLTSEEIQRSGATSIPEVLRLVPGVNVARLNANRWAITVRGFNSLYAQKLLVMIDGRTVYSLPCFPASIGNFRTWS